MRPALLLPGGLLLGLCATVHAQEGPTPDPVPVDPNDTYRPRRPPPPPPVPVPAPVPPPPPPPPVPAAPPPRTFDALSAVALFHGFCPDRAVGPGCSGGIFFGPRATMLLGDPTSTVAIAADFTAGFAFGFGLEGDQEPSEEKPGSMGHLMALAEGGVGPGVRLGPLDLAVVVGIGGEATTWGHTKVEDDAFAEAYWYGLGFLRLRAGEDFAMFATVAEKLPRWISFDEVFQWRLEAGISFFNREKEDGVEKDVPMHVFAWWADYGEITMAGLAVGVGGFPDKK